jgi:light-regulated signal transduction histidine kinase (bacteriophytochrome)
VPLREELLAFGGDMSLTSVDLLEELRAALDGIEPLIADRIVDIEMARLRVLADPALFRQEFASLVESAVAVAGPTRPISVRVSRTGSSARIDVGTEGDGTRVDEVIGSMTVALAPGGSSAADA